MKKKLALTVATWGILPFLANSLCAAMAYLAFEDGPMDSASNVSDIASGEIQINYATGDYSVIWNAYPTHAFWAPLEFTLVLYNLNTPQGTDIPDAFREHVLLNHSVDGYQMHDSIEWSGNEPAFTAWSPNDQLATYYTPEDGSEPLISSVSSTLIDGQSPSDQVLFVGYPVEIPEDPGSDPEDKPEEDTDGDGVSDHLDEFIESDLRATIILHGVDTGIINEIPGLPVTEFGATLADVIHQLEMEAANATNTMGQYVKHFGANLTILVRDGWITSRERARLIAIIAGSDG